MIEEVTAADDFCDSYLDTVIDHIRRIQKEERSSLDAAARLMAKQISQDRLVHVFGPGGHSNLATQELFFRAGGLMHMNAILDEGTLLSNGAHCTRRLQQPVGGRRRGIGATRRAVEYRDPNSRSFHGANRFSGY